MLIFIFTTLTFIYLDFILCFMWLAFAFSQTHGAGEKEVLQHLQDCGCIINPRTVHTITEL